MAGVTCNGVDKNNGRLNDMKKTLAVALAAAMLIGTTTFMPASAKTAEATTSSGFVTAVDNYFELDGDPFYYVGSNNYYLNYTSDTMIDDVLEDAASMGLKVMRCWGFIDGTAHNSCVMQSALGVYDDSGFERLDYAINKASTLGIKLIIPFVNNWDDFGGMNQYVEWAGASVHDDFYTNTTCTTGYKNYVRYMLNHVNTYSGIAYKDDPTVMAWELANEPRCTTDTTGDTIVNWADTMSTYIKTIDSNHLVTVGDEGFFNREGSGSDYEYNGGTGVDWDRLIELPNIDFETMHLYPDGWGKTITWSLQYINDHIDAAKTVGKPVILEEYGVASDQETVYAEFGDALYKSSTIGEGAAGNMFWLLTGINDDGTLYANWDGFRVTYPSTLATVLSGYADMMSAKNTGTAVNTSSISPTATTFDLNMANQADIPVTVTLNGNTLNGIYNGATALVNGTDYTVANDGTVTILSSYLAGQDVGTVKLRFDFSAGTDSVLTVTVTDTTPVAVGDLEVQMFNANTQAATNGISPHFKIINNGSSAIDLSTITIRYYFTENGTQSENFWCDYSNAGTANVTGTFKTLDTAATDADTYLEIGFTSAAGTLAAGASAEVQARFSKSDWSDYTQTDDYSFNSSGTSYTDWSKIAAYASGTLVWGTEA